VVETKENGGVGELEGGNGKGNTSVHRQNGPIGEAGILKLLNKWIWMISTQDLIDKDYSDEE
jgi:hypothetical protein